MKYLIKKRKLSFGFFFLLILSLWGCDGEWSSSEDFAAYRCSLDSWWGSSPIRVAVSDNSVYVLDQFATVYRYQRDPSRECAYEWDRNFASLGSTSLTGFADDVAFTGTSLYWNDGSSVKRYGDDSWNCNVISGQMAMTSSAVVVGGRNGIRDYRLNALGCTSQSTSFSGTAFVLALDANSSRVVSAEALTLSETAPERLVIYNRSTGNAEVRTTLSPLSGSEMNFCSASRIRFSNAGILLLDSECGTLGVFDDNGIFQRRINLSDLGIRNPKDLFVIGNDAYILVSSSFYLAYRLSLSRLLTDSYNDF